jgi:hypothetical protein
MLFLDENKQNLHILLYFPSGSFGRLLLLQLLEKFELIRRSTDVGQQEEANREHPERHHHHLIVANRLFWLCEIFVNFRIVSEFPIFALRSPKQLQFFSDFPIFARRAQKKKLG